MTTVALIGSYRVNIAEGERRYITDHVTGDQEQTERELAGLVLLEVLVSGATTDFDVGLLLQEGSDQAAWLERYFSADGLEYLGEEYPARTEFRVCFFMHYFLPGVPIQSPYGCMVSDATTVMPARLCACVYEHPG